jgi:hypothetical protein
MIPKMKIKTKKQKPMMKTKGDMGRLEDPRNSVLARYEVVEMTAMVHTPVEASEDAWL